jgi:hypothetical protein
MLGRTRGRWLDQAELRTGLRNACVVTAVVLGAFTVAVWARAALPVLLVLSVAEGATVAGVYGGFRALLWVVSPAGDLTRPQVLETLMTEVGFVVGPLLVVAIDAIAGVTAVFGAMAVLCISAAVALRGIPPLEPASRTTAGARASFAGLGQLALISALVAGSFNMIESSIPARVESLGQPAARGGVFLALLALGSCVGGIVAFARPPGRHGFARTGAALSLAFAALTIPGTLMPTPLPFAIVLPLAGVLLVPMMGLVAAEADRRIGPHSRAERFAGVMAIQMIGGGIGAVLSSALLGVVDPATVPRVSAAVLGCMGLGLAMRAWAAQRSVGPEVARVGPSIV